MAELGNVARPYAQAVYELAKQKGTLVEWSDTLEFLAAVARDTQMQTLLASPRLSPAQTAEIFLAVCSDKLDDQGQNLVKLLAENRRLRALPEILEEYRQLRASAEKTLHARLISAQPVDQAAVDNIAKALGKRLNVEVTLASEIDADLLGGAIIRAGDLVIDGSVRGRLARLAAALGR